MARLREYINGEWVIKATDSPADIRRGGSTGNLEDVTITPSETTQTRRPGTGYDAIRQVTVNAIPGSYVGTSVPRESGKTVTPGSSSQVAVVSGTYVTGDIVVSAAPQPDPPELQTKTATPSESPQDIIADSGYDGLEKVTVEAVPSNYVGSAITRKSGTTITPTKSQQTAVASGQYTTGNVLVAPIPSNYIDTTDANAGAADINSGKTAYVNGIKVTGSQIIQTFYTGSTTPTSAFGNNGDLYLKVVQ